MFPQAVIKPISALAPPITTPIAKTLSTDPEADRLSMLNRLAKTYGLMRRRCQQQSRKARRPIRSLWNVSIARKAKLGGSDRGADYGCLRK
ncbi:hypothetical protein D3Y57_06275 [Sphingomonas paeninsulae]|uniref:Uncharacterized protein n=1 Tax=Sphingomonas paeninsulae TaxID=2319844 RepID=A0A494T8I8_SPHPE|nr:hypothetical protein D3Y57_06275 [Sphingomonas paeninsulae]